MLSIRSFLRLTSFLILLSIFGTLTAKAQCGYDAEAIANAMSSLNAMRHMVTVVAHRGLWGQSTNLLGKESGLPENSIEAVAAAFDNCAEAVEVDVHLTSDGIPILMHDDNLGRTTDISRVSSNATCRNEGQYDPFTDKGCNPAINSQPWSEVREAHLVAWNNRNVATNITVPALAQLFDYYRDHRYSNLLVLDIKTEAELKAVWTLMNDHYDYQGRLARNWVVVKLNLATFPSPYNLISVLDSTGYSSTPTRLGDLPFQVIPLAFSNTISTLGGQSALKTAISEYANEGRVLVRGIELNLKSQNGLLQSAYNFTASINRPIAVFNPVPNVGTVNNDYAKAYYTRTGSCAPCNSLSTFFVVGESSDLRFYWDFLWSGSAKRFDIITTDDPIHMIKSLSNSGMRASQNQYLAK